jgi:hypothetical protein
VNQDRCQVEVRERQAGIPRNYKAGLGCEVVFDVAGRRVTQHNPNSERIGLKFVRSSFIYFLHT